MSRRQHLGRNPMRPVFGCVGLAAAGLLLPSLASAQRVIVVGAGGQFSTIQPAIQAAQPGDVVIVRSGTYPAFFVDRGITVIGEGATLTVPVHYPSINVSNIPPGQRAVVRGGFTGFPLLNVSVRDSGGHVHLQGLSVQLFAGNCAHLTVSGMNTMGSARTFSITDSKALIRQCQLECSNSLQLQNSSVVIAESTVRGLGNLLFPGTAVTLNGGSLTVAGAADTVLTATGAQWPAIDVVAGTVVLEPAVTLQPSGTAPPVRGGTVLSQRVPSVLIDFAPNGFTTRLHAPGALRGHTLLSLPLPGSVALPFGDLWLDPLHLVLDSGSMPASGIRTSSTVVLPPGLPPGITIVVQGLVAQPTGIQLSTAAVMTL